MRDEKVATHVVLALVCAVFGACLVTNEATFDAPDSPTQAVRSAPAADIIVRVPTAPSPECADEYKMAFQVRVSDLDVDQPLFIGWYVNDDLQPMPVELPPNLGKPERVAPLSKCISYDVLNRAGRCIRVRALVTSDFNKLYSYSPQDFAPNVTVVEWLVLRGSIDPDVTPYDCNPLPSGGDAGLSP